MDLLSEVLSKLDEWRHLSAYQLERRVDAFSGCFFPMRLNESLANQAAW